MDAETSVVEKEHRQGAQPLRGVPSSFSNTQPLPQSRSSSTRLPNGKISTNGPTWSAFGGSVPMGSVGLPSQRQSNGPMTSFAQTIGGSQPATPLDLSEFPSLSTNSQQQASSTSASLWATSGARSVGQPLGQRQQQQSMMSPQTPAQQQTQQQQDDLFSSSSQLPSTQGGYRFGGQNAVGQPQANPADEFPPLSRNINGDIGQDRATALLQGFGAAQGSSLFGGGAGSNLVSQNNGLLNALSSSSRVSSGSAHITSQTNVGGPLVSRSPAEGSRPSLSDQENAFGRSPSQTLATQVLRVEPLGSLSADSQGSSQTTDFRLSNRQDQMNNSTPEVEDPLAGFSDKDRFGLKGLTALLSSYPDQAALIAGLDISNFGFDVGASERITNMIWSPFDDAAPRPPIPKYILPDCYSVHNVQQIENKMSSFSDETLMYMFFSNPQDVQQVMAANELANRNWRYHKKLQTWLTKDDMMVPQPLGEGTERGYYIFFDKMMWTKERRELVLTYSDLEQVPPNGRLLQ